MLPNFLIIGAQKAGTTALYHYLGAHRQIFMSPVKEPHYFTFGDGHINYTDPTFDPDKLILTREAYEMLFDDVGEGIVAWGEASPSYLYNPRAPRRIYELIPNAKLIAVLRNPIDRAFSNYLHCRRNGIESVNSFAHAIIEEERRVEAGWSDLWHYTAQGFYSKQLQRYYTLFPKEQILILLYDDLDSNPDMVVKQILKFLEVDTDIVLPTSTRHNVSGIPKNRLFAGIYRTAQSQEHLIKRMVPASVRMQIRDAILARPILRQGDRSKLIDLYRQDILALQDVLQRDLSSWLN